MKEEVEREYPNWQIVVEFMPLNLASFQSVKEFTVAYREKSLPLHILINNAGIAGVMLSEFSVLYLPKSKSVFSVVFTRVEVSIDDYIIHAPCTLLSSTGKTVDNYESHFQV